jgi:hypothetical protein
VLTDPAKEIENKVAPRVAEARILVVIDQATLDAVGDRLSINKALQKEAADIFDPVIASSHEAHKRALAAKKKVTDPLTQEESILKLAAQTYVIEERRKAEERERIERLAREAEERRLLADAEEARRAEEARINAELEREHAEEVERALNALPADTPQEIVEALCNSPAPAPVSIPLDIPVLAPAIRQEPAVVLPKGMTVSKKYKAEVTSIALLCRAVAEGKVPASYVEANMTALNARARADKAGMSVPGVRAVEDFQTGQRGR